MSSLAVLICILLQLGAPVYSSIKISNSIHKYSTRYKIDPLLVIAVAYNENRFCNRHNNKTHDYGIMQIHCPTKTYMPWCRNINKLKNNIDYNIRIGIYILKLCKKKCKGPHHWIRHYNWYSKGYSKRILKIYKRIVRIKCQLLLKQKDKKLLIKWTKCVNNILKNH